MRYHSEYVLVYGRWGLKKSVILLLNIIFVLAGCASSMTNQSYKPPKVLFEDSAMARDVNRSRTSSDPQEVTDIFSSDDPQAVMWIKLGDVAGRHTLRWEWYDPEGMLYQCTEAVSINNDGRARPYITSWHKIAIKDEKAASLPGTWQVKVFLDDKLAANKSFEIKKISPFEDIIGRGPRVKRDPHKFAVVIGIEKYRKTPPVMFAGTDARVMKDFLLNRVGVPEPNILFLIKSRQSARKFYFTKHIHSPSS